MGVWLKKFIAATLIVSVMPVVSTIYDATAIDVSKVVYYNDIAQTVRNFESSVSIDNLCYLTIEVSQDNLLFNQGGLIYKAISQYIEIKDDTAPGWTHLTEDTHVLSGLTWALWQNQFDKDVFALVYSGTDDFLEDPQNYWGMMFGDDRCEQINLAIDVAKDIQNKIKSSEYTDKSGSLKKLYILGHSLGGYISSHVMSDLVDSEVAPNTTNSQFKVSDIDKNLKIDDIQCVTFGAPGCYTGNMKEVTVPIFNKKVQMPKWGEEKLENNVNGKYNKYITSFTNRYDPFIHWFLFEDFNTFVPLGNWIDIKLTKLSIAQWQKERDTLKWFKIVKKEINSILDISNVYYHLPHVYINALEGSVLIGEQYLAK
ncbi:MAG: hypothetical protein IJA61_00405 [Clostridia bacterium]|nr:hypothetical protein [Clostridia bacterium]